ncbi:DUF805 domain-containing protein [Sphingomonas sp. G-3-2-10]|uniref:DUF805 domain-containing protein n=1 Tax=Sphingomonas sp. G-3-2-10 TaxID=2728838 RepID=UPI00146B4B8C|nr:DUF805 domain-containing protein [Sphingomonas sp. G-3-2-10]NML06022.1 DUF805 domain-containing protein [Sphingomonas sp. G-3-2-10]
MPAAHSYRPTHWLLLALKPLRNMLIVSGRSTRSEVVAFFVLASLMNLSPFLADPEASPLLRALVTGWQIVWSLPWIALFVRRLHDQDRPAWWVLLMAVEAIVALPLLALREPGAADFLNLTGAPPLATALSAVFLASMLTQLVLMLLPGTPGPNRYGPDPRDA